MQYYALLQGVVDYRDPNYCNPRNTGIYKKFQVIRLSGLFTNSNSSQYYYDPDNRRLGFLYKNEAVSFQEKLHNCGVMGFVQEN